MKWRDIDTLKHMKYLLLSSFYFPMINMRGVTAWGVNIFSHYLNHLLTAKKVWPFECVTLICRSLGWFTPFEAYLAIYCILGCILGSLFWKSWVSSIKTSGPCSGLFPAMSGEERRERRGEERRGKSIREMLIINGEQTRPGLQINQLGSKANIYQNLLISLGRKYYSKLLFSLNI